MTRTVARTTLILAMFALIGCARKENIPSYPMMSETESLDLIKQRSQDVRDVSGQGTVMLTDAKNNSVRMDAAFVFAPPNRARVRAWKFGQAILDLTLTKDETWLFLPRRDDHADQIKTASTETSRALREWLKLLAGDLSASGATITSTSREITITRPAEQDGQRIVCTIDRATLTPRKYELIDAQSRSHFSLTLSRYQTLGATVWPTQIEASGGTGRIEIVLRELLLNNAPEAAFKPPARAERLK